MKKAIHALAVVVIAVTAPAAAAKSVEEVLKEKGVIVEEGGDRAEGGLVYVL